MFNKLSERSLTCLPLGIIVCLLLVLVNINLSKAQIHSKEKKGEVITNEKTGEIKLSDKKSEVIIINETSQVIIKKKKISEEREKSRFTIGVVGGINFPLSGYNVSYEVYDSSTVIVPGYDSIPYYHTEEYNASPAIGINLGLLLKYRVSERFSIQTDPSYSLEIGKIDVTSLDNIITNMLNIPIMGVINIKDNISVMLGPSIALSSMSDDLFKIASVFTDPMTGFNIGCTYQMKNGMNMGIKYKFNIGALTNKKGATYSNSGGGNSYNKTYNVSSLQILLGYNYNFKKKQKIDTEIDELKKMLSEILEKQESQDTLLEQARYRGGGDPLKGLNISKATSLQPGDYYALIIGIDSYKGIWTPLENAVKDARAIEEVLKTKYKFTHFRTLYDEEATGENIIKELEWLVENIKEEDNVFIYYSGHGEFKQSLKKGYWVPVDAQTTSTYKYISNSDIQTFLGGIKSKHTLLVSDACFSGDIFRGKTISLPFEDSEKYYKKVYELRSRQAITSGGMEPVMDGGGEGHSVFAYYLLKVLNENNNKYYDTGQLYNDIKIPVTNNSDQSPKLQPIKNTGDEGGQFIFIKK